MVVVLVAWCAATLTAPLVFYEASHRWEEDQPVSTALVWTLAALPLLAAALGARWRGRAGPFAAFAAATLTFAATLGWYRWIVPLGGDARWARTVATGLVLAAAGTALGHLAGRWTPRLARRRPGLWLAAAIAVAGAVFAPVTVRLGAEDSTTGYDEGGYGAVGPLAAAPGRSGVITLPGPGPFAVMAMGDPPRPPDCRVSQDGREVARAGHVAIPPRDYGGDYATYAWVATFRVPAAGVYTLDCRAGAGGNYTVGERPTIRGAVGSLIHWPVPLVYLAGALPGICLLAGAARRRWLTARPARSVAERV